MELIEHSIVIELLLILLLIIIIKSILIESILIVIHVLVCHVSEPIVHKVPTVSLVELTLAHLEVL